MRITLTHILTLVAATAVACGPSTTTGGDGGDGLPGSPDADPNRPDALPPPENAAVYAHSDRTLYRIDPDTLAVSLVGDFGWPLIADQMTDIAIDKDGVMIGVSFTQVYEIDPDTAAATHLSTLSGATSTFNALSFVPADTIDPSVDEILIGADTAGRVFRIDPSTGQATQIGSYGNELGSSGDIVSVRGFGTVATVKGSGDTTDRLARLDPTTFAAEVIGDTGVDKIWGLGFWGDKVYGFTDNREFVLIDVLTGAATPVSTSEVAWWGAGVTTAAPVIN
jgi:hypothetical protein